MKTKIDENEIIWHGIRLVPKQVYSDEDLCIKCYFFRRFFKRNPVRTRKMCDKINCICYDREDKKDVVWVKEKKNKEI